MDISVCIVNWNTVDMLYRCIRSIKEKTIGVKYEIIIVDNNSIDGSAEMVEREFPDCKLIKSKDNLGFAKGNNMAIKKADGKYILYLNPDTELVSNVLFGMFKFIEEYNDFGAVGCKIIYPDGSIQFTCARTFPTPFNQFCLLTMLNKLSPKSRLFSTIEMGYWDHEDSREIDCLSGACIMVRRNIAELLKGFDEELFMYAEDVDFCYRILQKGWKIFYLASEEIIHYEGSSSKQKTNRLFSTIMQRESNYYFIKKHFGGFKASQYKVSICFGSSIRLVQLLLLFPYFLAKHVKGQCDYYRLLAKYFNLCLWSVGLEKKIYSIN